MIRLIGNRVSLRSYRLEDIGLMYEWNQDAETTRWMGRRYRMPRTLDEITASVRKVIDNPPDDGIFFALADPVTDEYRGGIDLTSIDRVDRNGVLSLVVARGQHRNRGIGGEASRLLLGYAFGELGLHKVELRVWAANAAAIACYQKIGFKVEGTIRDHMFIDGRFHDLLNMGLLDEEFGT